MDEKIRELNNTFKSYSDIIIQIPIVRIHPEINIYDFLYSVANTIQGIFFDFFLIVSPSLRRHIIPVPSENSLTYFVSLTDKMHLNITGHVTAGIPDLSKYCFVFFIFEIAHQCRLQNIVLLKLLATSIHNLKIAIQIRVFWHFYPINNYM